MGCISKEPLLMSLTKELLLMGLTTAPWTIYRWDA